MADPVQDPGNAAYVGAIAAGVLGFLAVARGWLRRDKLDTSAAAAQAAYSDSAKGIVERLDKEIAELREELVEVRAERDDCTARCQRLNDALVAMAAKMLTVQGLQELGHSIIEHLDDSAPPGDREAQDLLDALDAAPILPKALMRRSTSPQRQTPTPTPRSPS